MADTKRLTIVVPEDIHQAFLIKSLTEKPRRSMKDRIVDFMGAQVGIKPEPSIDRRKLKRKATEEPPATKGKKR